MKYQGLILFVATLLGVVPVSCAKEEAAVRPSLLTQVAFSAEGAEFSAEVSTKATPLDNGFYASATQGAAGSETAVWTSAHFTLNGDEYTGDKWWPLENPSYHFYASNAPLTFAAGGSTVHVSSTGDIVCAYLPAPVFKERNKLRFKHIFSFINTMTVVEAEGYAISDVDICLAPYTEGTYNLRKGYNYTNGTGWTNKTAGEVRHIANASPGTKSVGMYLIPGKYTLTITWTATTDTGATDNYSVSSTVSLTAGKKSRLSCTLGGKPEVTLGVSLEDFETVDLVDDPSCLAFYAAQDGNFIWRCSSVDIARTLEYSRDFGRNWQEITSTYEGARIPVSAGDVVWFRGDNTEYADVNNYNAFDSSGVFYAYGDMASLLSGDGQTLPAYCFRHFFTMCSTLRIHPLKPLRLSAATLGNYCYKLMFNQCTGIRSAPLIEATQVGEYSCDSMFSGCDALEQAPALKATTLAQYCYRNMFHLCMNLVSSPDLPATTLAPHCYESMFIGCHSLVRAPRLPATTLAAGCYQTMFQNCQALTEAPALPAISLETECYESMFNGCSSLQYVKALFLTTPGTTYTKNWLRGVGSSGTFVKNRAASWSVSGNNGIPSGWTVQTE